MLIVVVTYFRLISLLSKSVAQYNESEFEEILMKR